MQVSELYKKLKDLGLPIAYNKFIDGKDGENDVSLPFILYREDDPDNFDADDKTYVSNRRFVIDLATEKKDYELEGKVEDLLSDLNLPYEKTENYIDMERLFQITYTI